MALIDDIIQQALQELHLRETQITAELVRSYEITLKRLERELRTIETQIAEAIASGQPVDAGWLSRQRWWREVETSINHQLAIYGQQELSGIAALQTGGVRLAVGMASEIATAAGSPFQGRVYAEAFERWVSAIQPDSPLRTISLSRHGAKTAEVITRHMTEGIGSGVNPRQITRSIMQELGGVGNEARILTLSRTETMRAFRGAQNDTMETLRQQNIVAGYVWLSALDSRCCIACIARHGQFSKEPWDQFHPNCRCINRPVVRSAIIPGGGWRGEMGEHWFAKQPEAVQLRMLGGDTRYAAYRDGVPLSDMVTVRRSPIWGDSVGIKPLSAMGLEYQPVPLAAAAD